MCVLSAQSLERTVCVCVWRVESRSHIHTNTTTGPYSQRRPENTMYEPLFVVHRPLFVCVARFCVCCDVFECSGYYCITSPSSGLARWFVGGGGFGLMGLVVVSRPPRVSRLCPFAFAFHRLNISLPSTPQKRKSFAPRNLVMLIK